MLEKEYAINFIKQLNVTTKDDLYDIRIKICELGLNTKDFKLNEGSSKLCIMFVNKPYVIKWARPYEIDEAMEEVYNYEKAVAYGLEKFFPKTAFLFEFNGMKFVVQEKIDCSCYNLHLENLIEKKVKKIGKTATEKIVAKMEKAICKQKHGFNRTLSREWAKTAISLYGKKTCKSLCDFIVENGINDLHESNLGFKNNKPIILDFSGYHR